VLRLGKPRPSPDGRVLAIRDDDGVRSDHLVIVQNWLSEAQARAQDSRQ
jgi:hypothetical protein